MDIGTGLAIGGGGVAVAVLAVVALGWRLADSIGDLAAQTIKANAHEIAAKGAAADADAKQKALEAERVSHAQTQTDLSASRDVSISLAQKIQRLRNGEDIPDSELAVAGDLMDRVLAE